MLLISIILTYYWYILLVLNRPYIEYYIALPILPILPTLQIYINALLALKL